MREWQYVTVASRPSRSIPAGLPRMALRPTTTARLAREVEVVLVQQAHDSAGRPGDEARQAEAHRRERVHGDPVDVLGRIDRFERGAFVDVRSHRVLDQDAVDARVGRQRGDRVDHILCGGGGGKGHVPRLDARALAPAALHPDVGHRGRVLPDQHRRQAGCRPGAQPEIRCRRRAGFDDPAGKGGAVHRTGCLRSGHVSLLGVTRIARITVCRPGARRRRLSRVPSDRSPVVLHLSAGHGPGPGWCAIVSAGEKSPRS